MNEDSKNILLNVLNEVRRFTIRGLSEEAYETAFEYECKFRNIKHDRQKKFHIPYKTEGLTVLIPDFILYIGDEKIFLEFKASKEKTRHDDQILKYMDYFQLKEYHLFNFSTWELIVCKESKDKNNKGIIDYEVIHKFENGL